MNLRIRNPVPSAVLTRLALAVTGFLLVVSGCAGRMAIPLEDLSHPPASDEYFVTMKSGEQFDFVTLSVSGGELKGTVRTIQKRVTGQGESERMEIRNQYRESSLQLTDIKSVEIQKSGPNNLVLAAAGAAIAVGVYAIVNASEDTGAGNGNGTGGGREPPPLPVPGRHR